MITIGDLIAKLSEVPEKMRTEPLVIIGNDGYEYFLRDCVCDEGDIFLKADLKVSHLKKRG